MVRTGPVAWEIPTDTRPDMHVPARLVADEGIVAEIRDDLSLWQLVNVTTLTGVVGVVAMPDAHQGYGFPVGTVAATALPHGVVSPGGVGYDINCGVRLLTLDLDAGDLPSWRDALLDELARAVPAGAGRGGRLTPGSAQFTRILTRGAGEVVAMGFGTEGDLQRTESEGSMAGAVSTAVSDRAQSRGADQLGTLGSGNHFLELQVVGEVRDPDTAAAFGLREGQVCVLIHCGSRGLGHQVCTDHVRRMDARLASRGERLADRQLACAPADSPEGREYLAAMACAANFAWANRQVIAQRVRESVARVIGRAQAEAVRQVYDVAHNVAKEEVHAGRRLLVHRKGATRAFGPARAADLPPEYRHVGQPVFVPGSMGTASWVLCGRDTGLEAAFGSACHGAGRRMSRTEARRRVRGADLRRDLAARGVAVRCTSDSGLAEEAPSAYRDVDRVVEVVEVAGLAGRVARLVPVGVVKG